MNLNNMLKDGSLSNLDWITDPATFEPLDKDTNKKDDLQLEWGMDGIDLEYQDEGKMTEDLGLTVPDKHPARPDMVLTQILQFASANMMQGVMGKKLVASLRDKFSLKALQKAVPELKKLLAYEGIVGCVAVDARAFSSCKEAIKYASKSPYKKFIKYIIGCKCGSHHSIAVNKGKDKEINITGNALDDFFSSDNMVHSASVRPFCKETMKPVMAGKGDLDDTEEAETFIDLVTTGNLNEDEAKEIRSLKKSSFDKIKFAFLYINKKKYAKATKPAKVEASTYKFSEMEVEVDKKFVAQSIDVDPVDHERDQAISIAKDGRKESIKVNGSAAALDVEVMQGNKVADLDVDVVDHQIALVADVAGNGDKKALDVDRGTGDMGEVQVNKPKKAQAPLEVDPVDHNLDREVNIAKKSNFVNQDVDSLVAEYEALDIQKEVKAQKDLEVDKLKANGDISLDIFAEIDINEIKSAGVEVGGENEISFDSILAGNIDIDGKGAMAELEISNKQEDLEIDAATAVDPEFAGGDEFDLNEKTAKVQQEVDMKSDFSF